MKEEIKWELYLKILLEKRLRIKVRLNKQQLNTMIEPKLMKRGLIGV